MQNYRLVNKQHHEGARQTRQGGSGGEWGSKNLPIKQQPKHRTSHRALFKVHVVVAWQNIWSIMKIFPGAWSFLIFSWSQHILATVNRESWLLLHKNINSLRGKGEKEKDFWPNVNQCVVFPECCRTKLCELGVRWDRIKISNKALGWLQKKQDFISPSQQTKVSCVRWRPVNARSILWQTEEWAALLPLRMAANHHTAGMPHCCRSCDILAYSVSSEYMFIVILIM